MAHDISEQTRAPNSLIRESSPYLLQHAYNPVNWLPWDEEAFERAQKEEKPIFLSIGYSSCHWCHVMERESFEDETVAAFMNDNFVCVKVDREERPDLDDIYMAAVQLMIGSGGWPLNVFLTPDLKPFYAGTYFPPTDTANRPGFTTVLKNVAEAWTSKRNEITAEAEHVVDAVNDRINSAHNVESRSSSTYSLDDVIENACASFSCSFDSRSGGFGHAPKFPPSGAISFLLRQYARKHQRPLYDMASFTLEKMARGGIYDHLGGGFHRYSIDANWSVPHFEKMLCDNALIAKTYAEAYQLTHNPLHRRIATETLDYVLREMSDPGGGFHSSEDADNDDGEGAFYLWTRNEILSILDKEDGEIFCRFFSVEENGNVVWRDNKRACENILLIRESPEDVSRHFAMTPEQLGRKIRDLRSRLMITRKERPHPGKDNKVLTSWNALMISAFTLGYQIIEDPRYLTTAVRAAEFILHNMAVDGELLHAYRKGESHIQGFLEDYAFVTLAFIDLYEVSFDLRWIMLADVFARKMIPRFWDDEAGQFLHAAKSQTRLFARSHPTFDGSEPSGNSAAAIAYLRLARLVDDWGYEKRARSIIEKNTAAMRVNPQAYSWMLCAADMVLHTPCEIAVVGKRNSEDVLSLLRALHTCFVPNKVVAFLDPLSQEAHEIEARIPMLKGKKMAPDAAAYVCKDYACGRPARTPQELLHALGIDFA